MYIYIYIYNYICIYIIIYIIHIYIYIYIYIIYIYIIYAYICSIRMPNLCPVEQLDNRLHNRTDGCTTGKLGICTRI